MWFQFAPFSICIRSTLQRGKNSHLAMDRWRDHQIWGQSSMILTVAILRPLLLVIYRRRSKINSKYQGLKKSWTIFAIHQLNLGTVATILRRRGSPLTTTVTLRTETLRCNMILSFWVLWTPERLSMRLKGIHSYTTTQVTWSTLRVQWWCCNTPPPTDLMTSPDYISICILYN